MKILFKNAYVLTMKDGEKPFISDVLVEDKIISKIAKEINDSEAQIIDASNTVLMPGFKNAHTHSAMVFSRSSSDNLTLWDWLSNCIFPMEEQFIENDVYSMSKVAFLEYLTSGITACYDMYYFPHEIARAAKDIGFKAVILAAPPADRVTAEEIKNTFVEIRNLDKDLIDMRLGVHAEYTTPNERLAAIKEMCDEFKMPFSTHASETLNEVNGCKERHNGLTPTELFDSLGLFKYGGILFHNVVLTENDIKIMKDRGIYAVTCPGSNSKLASGIAPISDLVKAGIDVCVGTDGAGSNNCLDMFKEMHLLYSLAKIKENDATALNAFDILKMATVNGAKALGLNDALYIEEGAKADLMLIDLLKPNMQPINNLVSNIVYSGSKDNIKLTMINGKILYQDGKFNINEDLIELYKTVQEINDRLNKNNKYKI
jgi:5-methylthioadenosine/S-adenosylhomocysteine deaminase